VFSCSESRVSCRSRWLRFSLIRSARFWLAGHPWPLLIDRDQVATLLEPEVVALARDATQRRTGWWLRHGFRIKVVHSRLDISDPATALELLPRLYGERGRAFLTAPHPAFLTLKLGLFHLIKR